MIHDALGVEAKRHSAFDSPAGTVAGLADTGGLLGVFERHLDGPAACVAFHDGGDWGCQVGGDQREVGFTGFDEHQDTDRAGAEHAAPQAPHLVNPDSGGASVAGDRDRGGRCRGARSAGVPIRAA